MAFKVELRPIDAIKTDVMAHCIGSSMTVGQERLGQVLIIMAMEGLALQGQRSVCSGDCES